MPASVPDLLSVDASRKSLARTIDERESQELVIALVGPVGSGVSTSAALLKDILKADFGYTVAEPFKQSDIIRSEAHRVGMASVPRSPLNDYINHMQTAGNKLREKFGSNYLAEKTIEKIVAFRKAQGGIVEGQVVPGRRAYLIDSLKNIEELALLRKIYRDTLCVFGVFAPDDLRKQRLVDSGAQTSEVTSVIERDLGEAGTFGQMTRKVFSQSDFFVCNDQKPEELRRKLRRFLDLVFDVGIHTPTRDEAAMYNADAAGASSACMSRQVGAAIVSAKGELIAVGRNDVPKFGGGLYSEDDQSVWDGKSVQDNDHRCFKWGGCICHNEMTRQKIMGGIVTKIANSNLLKKGKTTADVREVLKETDVDDLTEYSRSIHAEMEAILSVAREGKHSLVGATLFSTVYPCHNCARHIVAAGITTVSFIHPYRKSKAVVLHHDAITENGAESNKSCSSNTMASRRTITCNALVQIAIANRTVYTLISHQFPRSRSLKFPWMRNTIMKRRLLPISNTRNIMVVEDDLGDGMPKEREPQNGQYQLEFEVAAAFERANTVVNFVDTATREVRREAVERLKKSGIFQLPSPIVR